MSGKKKAFEGWLSRVVPIDFTMPELTQSDLDESLLTHSQVPLLFGHSSAEKIMDDLRRNGLAAELESRGYHDLEAELDHLPMGQEGMRLTAGHATSQERLTLLGLRGYWGQLDLLADEEGKKVTVLVWDWLELRDPVATFPANRPALPGQTAPGLAIFHRLVEMMRTYVEATQAQALVTIPQYFHNAVLYWKDPSLRYRFFDRERHGELLAQMRDLLEPGSLHDASWAFAENRVEVLRAGEGETWQAYPWTPSELVLGLTSKLRKRLAQPDPLIEKGQSCSFRIRETPHPDLDGSFHLAGSDGVVRSAD